MIFVHAGFGERGPGFADGWELQKRVHARRVAGELGDTVLLLEHPPTYTVGRRADPGDLLDTGASEPELMLPGAPVVRVERSGGIAWHGPGQLVAYPVVALEEDPAAFTGLVARALVRVCGEFGVPATVGALGVMVAERRVATLGLRVARGVSMHGFALNCDPDLSWFDRIPGPAATSLSREAGRPISVREVLPAVERHLAERLGALETFHRTLVQLESG